MVVFYGNPFGFILRTLPVPFLKAVVLVIAAVEYAAKNNIQRDRRPVITGTSPVAMFVQIPGQVNQGAEFFVFVMNQMGDVVLVGVEAESLFLRVIIVAVRNTSAVPLPVAGSGNHSGSDTFRGHVTLQLRKDKDNFEHRFSHSRTGVELLVFRDKGNAQVFKLLVHLCKVQKVSGDAVNLPDQQMRVRAGPKLRHHFLKFWPDGIFARVPGILEDCHIVSVQYQLGVGNQILTLHRQRVPVDLMQCRDSYVDSHFCVSGSTV